MNLLVTALATVAIYTTPGLHRNHLIELHAAAVVFVITTVAHARVRLATGIALLMVAAVTGIVQTLGPYAAGSNAI